mmetsp:Transcript_132669/g.322369  ORF Transcript_132669/g.322369 Transcript_132669/m.322369 type:complete len:217 (-) Transcript_132669:323-973(-)
MRAAWTSKPPPPWRASPTMPLSSWARAPPRAATAGASPWMADVRPRASTSQAPAAAASTDSRTHWLRQWSGPIPGQSSWPACLERSSCRGSTRCPPSSPTSCQGSRQAMPSLTCSLAKSTHQPSFRSQCPTGRTRLSLTRASIQGRSVLTTCTMPCTRRGCWWATATTTPMASTSPRASPSATDSPTPPSPTPASPSADGACSSRCGTLAPRLVAR